MMQLFSEWIAEIERSKEERIVDKSRKLSLYELV